MLLGAIVMVLGANDWLFTNPGGGWEYSALWAVGPLVLAGTRNGAWAALPTPAVGRPVARVAA